MKHSEISENFRECWRFSKSKFGDSWESCQLLIFGSVLSFCVDLSYFDPGLIYYYSTVFLLIICLYWYSYQEEKIKHKEICFFECQSEKVFLQFSSLTGSFLPWKVLSKCSLNFYYVNSKQEYSKQCALFSNLWMIQWIEIIESTLKILNLLLYAFCCFVGGKSLTPLAECGRQHTQETGCEDTLGRFSWKHLVIHQMGIFVLKWKTLSNLLCKDNIW